jgi:Immunity protein 8
MQAVLKRLHCTDIANVETYVPEEEDNFGFVLRAMVGPLNEEGEESFDITVCTPKWLTKTYQPSEVLLGLHKLLVFRYDYLRVRGFIEKFLMRCSGDTWQEVGQKVSLLGQCEFENYRPYGPNSR